MDTSVRETCPKSIARERLPCPQHPFLLTRHSRSSPAASPLASRPTKPARSELLWILLSLAQRRCGVGIDSASARQFPTFFVVQVRTEMKQRIQDVVAFEIGRATREMHEPCGRKTALLVENEAYAPGPAGDGLVTTAALGLPARSAFGAVYPRQAPVCRTAACRTLERFRCRQALFRLSEGLEQRLPPRRGLGCARQNAALPSRCAARNRGIWRDHLGQARRCETWP